MMTFEEQLNNLLERTKSIKAPINVAPSGMSRDEYNAPSAVWMNDVQIFYSNYLKNHALGEKINTLLFHGKYSEVVSALKSISNDRPFVDQMNGISQVPIARTQTKTTQIKTQSKTTSNYDVFISHANEDKRDYVNGLKKSLEKLGVEIFYDKDTLKWGDDWPAEIRNGIKKSEFAVIVISENFFDREWTEKELKEFLLKKNKNKQNIVFPILKGITFDQLKQKYPKVADIYAIDSQEYSTDEIAIMFAERFIKRLKKIVEDKK